MCRSHRRKRILWLKFTRRLRWIPQLWKNDREQQIRLVVLFASLKTDVVFHFA